MSTKALRDRLEQRLALLLEETKQRLGTEALPAPNLPAIASAIEQRVETLVSRLVEADLQRAVLDRAELASGWDLADADQEILTPADAELLKKLVDTERDSEPPTQPSHRYWPPNVAPAEVANALERTRDPDAMEIATALRQGWLSPANGDDVLRAADSNGQATTEPEPTSERSASAPRKGGWIVRDQELPLRGTKSGGLVLQRLLKWPILDCARIVDIMKRVQVDRLRPAMAIDAGKEHHALMAAMRDFPKDPVAHRGKTQKVPQLGDRIEVLAPGEGGLQLTLPLEGVNLNEAMVNTLRMWRGWEGLKHWAAVHRLLSIEGSRAGRVRWTLERHLDAIGASTRARQDPTFRARVGHEVELLTKLELAIYAKDGSMRMRRALLTPTAKFDRIQGAEWALEGMELEIHPMLYSGVRDPESGELGANWFPQAAELPRLDHVKHPHALALGLIFPIRWRWDWANKLNHTRMKGLTLLATAGITFKRRRASEAWGKLQRDLAELQRIGALGQIEWEGEPWTAEGICLLYPPQWARDRTVNQLPPVERAMQKEPLTGSELVDWRKREGISQGDAATQLGVGIATIKRAEASGETPLGPALAKAFARLAARP